LLRERLSPSEGLVYEHLIRRFDVRPHFLIMLRDSSASLELLSQTIQSVSGQNYHDWSMVVSCDAENTAAVKEEIAKHCAGVNDRISFDAALNLKTSEKRGAADWVMVLEPGDKLAVNALFEFASEINCNPAAEFIYGDDRRSLEQSSAAEAFFKPDWSLDLLLASNYIGRSFCVKRSLLTHARIVRLDEVDGYDLVLRCTESANAISHVRQVLCEYVWRTNRRIDKEALGNAVKRRKLDATIDDGLTRSTYQLRAKQNSKELVSIIIPTCAAGGLIEKCLKTLKEITSYKHFEIICIDNIVDADSRWKLWLRENADVIVEISESFNWSRFNNRAAREASGSLLLFLNDDIEITEADWLDTLVGIAQRSDVGVVGPRLLYPDGKVQHAGMFLSKPGLARHAFRFLAADDPGYFELALTQRNVIAVTGACLMVRREVFEKLGGFDESHAVINNDLDFCLKSHASGLWNVFTPFATLTHHELASRANLKDIHDSSGFNSDWEMVFTAGDPFFHPSLNKDSDIYEYEAEPACLVFSGRPRYRHQDIRRILVVKVDHIGDFVTAFPAFRKIKQRFPSASLHVLAAPSAKHLIALEPSIDEMIPFEFFHAKSSLGRNELGVEQLEALRQQLLGYQFDVAIDLRKHTDTRKLLRYAGAKHTAGFDYQNQFPWLDIAMQWEGDPTFVAKRQHISDDLINLVDAVIAAGEHDHGVVKRADDWLRQQVPLIARLNAEGIYSRPVICVHPAAGNEFKQWPPAHFAALINSLIEIEDVNVAVIGGSDEAELAEQVIALTRRRERVVSFAGKLKLDELPYFLESCALFVGNDSGPKHMAAALGVPTLGVHSGVIDAKEWGPVGEIALAIKSDVTCSPCYLAKREDCHRDVACLQGLAPADVLAACRRLLAAKHGLRIN
jgi:ADP-heptose:LPS heptosyltransferase/GT2 family glycosyltransferase